MFDAEDLKILHEFSKLKIGEEKTLVQIVSSICKNPRDREYQRIRQKILRMSAYGLFKIGNNSHVSFTLVSDRVHLRRFSLPTKRSSCIAVLIEGKWIVFEI